MHPLFYRHSHGGDEDHEEGEMTDEDREHLLIAKICLIVFVGLVTFALSLLPWLLKRQLRNSMAVLTVGMVFAGGIILGSGLCHLYPSSSYYWTEYFEDSSYAYPDFPFTGLLAGAALLILVVVDKLLISRGMEHNHGEGGHNHMVIELPESPKSDLPSSPSTEQLFAADEAKIEEGRSNESTPASSPQPAHKHKHKHGHKHKHEKEVHLHKEKHADNHCEGHVHSKVGAAEQGDDADENKQQKREKVLRAWVFFVALSLHSIFDGLSIGAEAHIDGFYGLLVAVLAHKLLDGFALGVPVFFAKLPLKQTLFALIFCAAMTPLGIGIGMAAVEATEGKSSLLASAIVLSMSTGTFLYMSLVEMIPSGLESYGWAKTKLFAGLLGFGIMALIALWV
eukprot:TRINITY_DN582_c0_g1_i1.p1 TRINITY_DN582_c0_g1~~TRINITY_DN582_c0_g1_i1.p1  ORF type:complete len:395 (+),score=103.71 TRINITY_DN582_c0_g1_i1:113-1297(+)